jgi:N-acetylglutamate synthase-like GNAT family acetyltransferase
MKVVIATSKDVKELSAFILHVTKEITGASQDFIQQESIHFTVPKLYETIKDNQNLFLIAKEKNKIIGHCQGIFFAGTCWIEGIGVSNEVRKRGIAGQLLKILEKEAKKRKVHLIWANILTKNKTSLNVAYKNGFKKAALLKNHLYHQDFILIRKYI